MRHARAPALDALEPLLGALRTLPGLTEKQRGTFYRKSRAFLHFHEDPAGLFADIRDPAGDGFERIAVTDEAGRATLLALARARLGQASAPAGFCYRAPGAAGEEAMESEQIEVTARHDLTPEQIDGLEDRLYEFNAARSGYRDAAPLGFAAELRGELIGAVAGYTWGGVCELRQVWVHEAHRGRGLGRMLMDKAIQESKARGCATIFLATYDFQAPEFYARLGFRTVAEIADKPLGHTEFVMRLSFGERQAD